MNPVSPLRQWQEIVGSAGVVTVPQMWQLPRPRAAIFVHCTGTPEEIAIEGEDQIQHMIEAFGRALLQGEPVRPAPQEAVRMRRVRDALAKSARDSQPAAV